MERDEVRRRLAALTTATTLQVVARRANVPVMTLQRFVSGEVEQPREPNWSRLVALAEARDTVRPDEAAGVLSAVARMRLMLDALEHEARAATSQPDERAAVIEARRRAATPPRRGTPRPAANGE